MNDVGQLWAHFKEHRWALAGSGVLLGVAALIPAGLVWVFEALLSTLDGRPVAGMGLGGLCTLLVAGTSLRFALVYARTRWTKSIALRATAQLRARVLAASLHAQPDPGVDMGERVALLCDQVDGLQYAVSAWVTLVRNPIVVFTVVCTAAWMVPDLVLFGLVMVPMVAGAAWWGGRRLRKRGRQFRRARSRLMGLTTDQLSGAIEIQRAHAHEAEARRFSTVNEADRAARLALETDRVLPSALTQVAVVTCAAALLWMGGNRVLAGDLEFSRLAAFAAALALLHRPLGGLAEVWSLLQHSLGTLESVHALLAERPLDRAGEANPLTGLDHHRVQIRSLSVRRGSRKIFEGVDLVFHEGEVTALTGLSGVGKSSLLAAIEGTVPNTEGTIEIGGVDLCAVAPFHLRKAVAFVPQQPFLFSRSIRDNVALGRPEASDASIEAALTQAGAGFVHDLPDGLHTRVGERGGRLSGGEAQRIVLARALLQEARVLLLDEATNQVDSTTEQSMLTTLRQVAQGRVVVLVAHSPQTLAACDRVWSLTPRGIQPWQPLRGRRPQDGGIAPHPELR